VVASQPIDGSGLFWPAKWVRRIPLLNKGLLSFESLEWLESDYSDILKLAEAGMSIHIVDTIPDKVRKS
jgi:hypothetical protein